MSSNLNLIHKRKWVNSQIDSRISIVILIIGFILIIFTENIFILTFMLILNIILFILLPNSSIKKLILTLIFLTIFVTILTFIKILSLFQGTISILKLFNLNILFSWFYLGVPPHDLTRALVWYKIPYSWAWTLSSSFRFIDLFIRETKDIYITQLLRQIPLDGSLPSRLKFLPSVILPLIIRTQIRTNQLTEALYIRGWNPNAKLGIYSGDDFNKLKNFFWLFAYLWIIIILYLPLI
ncbi:MAG: energy-coupling factor transporter transmembrane component T [Candidatus Hodarchaeales archaeon]|jgi:energy-coupling factor transporter transmembrane protein EcfT